MPTADHQTSRRSRRRRGGAVLLLVVGAGWTSAAQPVSLPAEAPPPAQRTEEKPQSRVTLRGQSEPGGIVTELSEEGVLVDGAWISLDRVRAISGPLSAKWETLLPIADKAWRARTRLDRGDAVGAEPLFEELFTLYAGKPGPTAAMVATGVLRCRLRRGVVAGSVAPWLGMIRASAQDPSLLDRQTGLVPAIPPIWLNTPATQALARAELVATSGGEPDRAELLSLLYRQSARWACGITDELPPQATQAISGTTDEGVRLVSLIVKTRASTAAQRAEGRAGLREILARRPAQWQEAWIRCALGRSWLEEPGREEHMLGVAELLALPATIERVNPYLTGLALAESAVALNTWGDSAGAAKLRDELVLKFPDHPALDWDAVRTLRSQPTTASTRNSGNNERAPAANPNAAASGERER